MQTAKLASFRESFDDFYDGSRREKLSFFLLLFLAFIPPRSFSAHWIEDRRCDESLRALDGCADSYLRNDRRSNFR